MYFYHCRNPWITTKQKEGRKWMEGGWVLKSLAYNEKWKAWIYNWLFLNHNFFSNFSFRVFFRNFFQIRKKISMLRVPWKSKWGLKSKWVAKQNIFVDRTYSNVFWVHLVSLVQLCWQHRYGSLLELPVGSSEENILIHYFRLGWTREASVRQVKAGPPQIDIFYWPPKVN